MALQSPHRERTPRPSSSSSSSSLLSRLLLLLLLMAVLLATALRTASAHAAPANTDVHLNTIVTDAYPCMHDGLSAAHEAAQHGRKVYVTTVGNNSTAASNSPRTNTKTHAKQDVEEENDTTTTTATGHQYRHTRFNPRHGAEPASVDFTINSPPHAARVNANTDDEWQPIRIRAFYEDLLDSSRYCSGVGQSRPDFGGNMVSCSTAADVLTAAKRKVLMESLVPAATAMHASRLMVRRVPADQNVVLSAMPGSWCGSFTVPAAHRTTGISDADFVVYVAAGPTSTPTSFVAWAITCQWFAASGRPAVGAIYFNPRYLISSADQTDAETAAGGVIGGVFDNRIRVAAHELLHALGFSFSVFQAHGMVATLPTLREKTGVVVINSSAVRAAGSAQFGCADATSASDGGDAFPGMELEETTSSGTTSSHWKRRNLLDELMAPVANGMRYSALSLAAMVDTGLYRAAPGASSEYLGWGYQSGCAMLNKKCIKAGTVPTARSLVVNSGSTSSSSSAPSVFCASSSRRYCTRDRLSIGQCYIRTYTSSLPKSMQYFISPTQGGGESYVDYCPTIRAYGNTPCRHNAGSTTGDAAAMPGSVSDAENGRCFEADDNGSPLVTKADFARQWVICADVVCDFKASTYRILFKSASKYINCPAGGSVDPSSVSADVFQSGGRVQCPSFLDVCAGNIRATVEKEIKPADWGDGAAVAAARGLNGGERTVAMMAVAAVVLSIAATGPLS